MDSSDSLPRRPKHQTRSDERIKQFSFLSAFRTILPIMFLLLCPLSVFAQSNVQNPSSTILHILLPVIYLTMTILLFRKGRIRRQK